MRSHLFIMLLLSAMFGLSACATVQTRPLSNATPGIAYQLPQGKMRLRVVEAEGVLSVLLDGPIVSGDPGSRLVAYLPQSGVADNNVTVTVDPKTNLLDKVDVTSTGRLTDILTNVAKIPAFLQASDETHGVVLFSGAYDIDRLPAAADTANHQLSDYYAMLCGRYTSLDRLPFAKEMQAVKGDDTAVKAFMASRLKRCRLMALSSADRAAESGLIRITVSEPGNAPRSPWPTSGPITQAGLDACGRGICYRPYTTRLVQLTVRGAFTLSDVFLIPDTETLLHVDLPAGVFAEQKYTLDFSDGVLTSYQRNGKSELVGLTALPVTIATAILSAPAEALGLKQKKLEAETNYLNALGTTFDKKAAIGDKCKTKPALCPSTAYKVIGGSIAATAGEGAGSAGDKGAQASGQAQPGAQNGTNQQNGPPGGGG